MSSLQSNAGQGTHQGVLFLHLVAIYYFFLGFGGDLIYTGRKLFSIFYTICMQDSFNTGTKNGFFENQAVMICWLRPGRF